MKSILLLLIAVGLAAHEARAAQTVGLQGWCQYSNSDFTIVSQMNEADTADWAGRFNQFIHAMKGRLPGDPRVLGPFTLVLFNGRPDLYDNAPLRDNGSPSLYLGAFSRRGGWGEVAATSEKGSSQNTQRMIFETGVEWLLSADHRDRPLALSQGLGEVYGAYVIENGVEEFGRPVQGWTSRLRKAVQNPLNYTDRFLKIEDLLAVKDFNSVADRHGEPMFDVESWEFAHFLLFSKDMADMHGMDRLLDAFAHHLSPHDALAKAFGAGAETLNMRFQNYILGGDFFEVTAPIEQAPLGTALVPADPAFVASTLARLEAFAKRDDKARAYAEEAIQLAPNDVRPREALALVDFMAHEGAQAAADCREAIRLNTKDGWTWFEASQEAGATGAGTQNSGAPLRLTADQARDAVNAAEKAILYGKGIQSAYDRVAFLIPAVSHATEDDGKFLALGRELFPDDAWIEIGHAQWGHRIHDDALALKIIGNLLARSSELRPEQLNQARALQNDWAAGRD
jgi:tetratricopeptide (TPR) repeat protein